MGQPDPYLTAKRELDTGRVHEATAARAFADAAGDQARSHALYIQYRVAHLTSATPTPPPPQSFLQRADASLRSMLPSAGATIVGLIVFGILLFDPRARGFLLDLRERLFPPRVVVFDPSTAAPVDSPQR